MANISKENPFEPAVRRESVARRLWLGFGLLVVMLTVSGLVSYWQMGRIDADLLSIVEIEEPLEHAVLEMEIQAGETARAVLHHIHRPDPIFYRQVAATEERLNCYARQYDQFAQTDEQRRLGKRVAKLYAEFRLLGAELMDLADRRQAGVIQLRQDVAQIDQLLEEMLGTHSEARGADNAVRMEAALRMQVKIEQTFAAVEAYTVMSTAALRQEVDAAIAGFDKFADAYRQAGVAAANAPRFQRLEECFADATTAARQTLELSDQIAAASARFENTLEVMDRCLDHEIQPLIRQHAQAAAHDALQSSKQAVLTQVGLCVLGIGFGVVVGWYVSRGVIRPVRQLVRGATIIGSGERDHRIVPETNDEFGQLAQAFNGMVDNLNRSADDLLAAQQREEGLRLAAAQREIAEHAAAAKTDALTQLSNRRGFDECLELAAAESVRCGNVVSVALFDVDRFKQFNDDYGHQTGDEVLRSVARTLAHEFKKPDFVARFGGEEFAIVMPGSTAEAAAEKADCARQAIEATEAILDDQRFHVTASGGVAELGAGEGLDALIRRADQSLYAAKDAGRNRVHWHNGAESCPMVESAKV